jgi:hypothetical protein
MRGRGENWLWQQPSPDRLRGSVQVRRAGKICGMETSLRLLMSDGALDMEFQPKLTAKQYAELLKASASPATRAELRITVAVLAKRWGSAVLFDDES